MRFDNCFCTNAICTPSRAVILTGTHSHVSGVTTLHTPLDNRRLTFPKLLQQAGYQTAVFGKWHLGEGPSQNPGDRLAGGVGSRPQQGRGHQRGGPIGPFGETCLWL